MLRLLVHLHLLDLIHSHSFRTNFYVPFSPYDRLAPFGRIILFYLETGQGINSGEGIVEPN